MAGTDRSIVYYFAPHSPHAYLGHARLLRLAARHGATVDPRPFDLAAVFRASGGVASAERAPQRQRYRLLELQRWAAHLGVPLDPQPRGYPVDQTAASLLLVAARQQGGAARALALAAAIMRALWAEDRDIADLPTLARLADGCGFDGRRLAAAIHAPEPLRAYRDFTAQALAAGVFGSPWYVVDGQGFWGQDRLDFVERQLQAGPGATTSTTTTTT